MTSTVNDDLGRFLQFYLEQNTAAKPCPEDQLRIAGCLLKLSERFMPQRSEAARARALRFGDPSCVTIKHIPERGLDQQPSLSITAAPALIFVRTVAELVGHLTGE